MFAFLVTPSPLASASGRAAVCPRTVNTPSMNGKGFGGGEATRDPEPTKVDPNDPKGKQKAIHKADSFEEYLRKRKEAQQQGQ
mmetsp:Transcript_6293/g.16385  ORF Transcript_6293/g.16385 Transcript_6293/m.16385 type:complete len:83 (-) Transcript_6293:163-411(-)